MKLGRLILGGMVLLAGAAGLLFAAPASAQMLYPGAAPGNAQAAYTCADLNNPDFDAVYGIGTIGPVQLFAGETITLIATPDSDYTDLWMFLVFGGTPVAQAPTPGPLIYTVPEDMVLESVTWYLMDYVSASWQVSCTPASDVEVLPGCDALLPIPSTAVVGAFVADAPTYWQPGKLTNPLVTIEAGNTAWVLGKDVSGTYYKIIWVCDYLWVPVNTIGPNNDAVWRGTPLPVGVVE